MNIFLPVTSVSFLDEDGFTLRGERHDHEPILGPQVAREFYA
jgi:hypothetical protein